MRHPLTRLGPVLWALCACLLLLPQAAAAGDPSLAIDGDGRHVRVLVSHPPLHHVAASDLDGDGSDFGPTELTRTSLAAPPAHVSIACAPQDEPARPASSGAEPFAPRPPPA